MTVIRISTPSGTYRGTPDFEIHVDSKRIGVYLPALVYGNMTPEGKIKGAVDQALKYAGAYKHKPVQNGMGSPALDYHVCCRGFYAAIETKRPGENFTKRQARTATEALRAGASVFLVDDVTGPSINDLCEWLSNPRANVLPIRTAQKLAEVLGADKSEQADDRSGDSGDDT